MHQMRSNLIIVGLFMTALLLPVSLANASQIGLASWYALHSRTASGEQMNPNALTAAHRSLPFGTKVRVENLKNGRSVVVRINDRGPFSGGRVIDVSRAAASRLGMIGSGTAKVRLTSVSQAPLRKRSANQRNFVSGGKSTAASTSKQRRQHLFRPRAGY